MEINNADGTTFTQTMSGDYQNKLMTMLNTLNREVTNISLVEKYITYFIYIYIYIYNLSINAYSRYVFMVHGLKTKEY